MLTFILATSIVLSLLTCIMSAYMIYQINKIDVPEKGNSLPVAKKENLEIDPSDKWIKLKEAFKPTGRNNNGRSRIS